MVSQAAMRGQRVVESECRCWNPAVWLLVSLLGSLVLVAVSVLRNGDMKISRRAVNTIGGQTPVGTQHQVRLVNRYPDQNRCEGRVEVFYNDSWGTVCDDDWDMVDANVVCRQLNCGVAVAVGSSSRFGQGTGPILLDNVDCKGSETDLSQCRTLDWGVHNCYHYEDVGVTCKEPEVVGAKGFDDRTTPPWENFGLRDGTIRLKSGQNACQGRVEIYHQGKWGTVCDDEWDFTNAQVVCQQIGCGSAVYAHTNSYFGYGTGRILLDNVRCIGNEQDLTRCKSLGWGKHNCGHHEDAGVTCTGSSTIAPVATDYQRVRIGTYNTEATEEVPVTTTTTTTTTVTIPAQTKGKLGIRVKDKDSNNTCQGRVEVLYLNIWGTVCDDGWDMSNAIVVCRQLGCGPAIAAKNQAYFGYGSGPTLLDNVECSGAESELSECFHLGWGQHNCGHHEDAGVICAPADFYGGRDIRVTENITDAPITTPQPSEGMLRLVDGQHQCEGRVEMFSNSRWGTVCDDAWDLPDAQVVCRQLGCGEATAARGEAFFGPGSGLILLDNLKCSGAEASLQECSHISWNVHNCDHSEDAGVTCSLS
ncbi:scavenger receptor cysteine-rich domain-containing group B protein [Sebastes umbrosus]|uniref:scavenger receptor cysteine-rich domain-containing group B protein n=1 Tax=Sebastes umbrosus TaxID=72105 RepID=UPI00189CE512|nr:scavenger receptor cysteine-rich domain-containing group B protein [Sebastes umbrosus]